MQTFHHNLSWNQRCIFRLTCSHRELTEDRVLTSAYVKFFRTVTRNAVNESVWRRKKLFLTSLKQICNECLIKFSENQSAPKLENRKTSPCSPCAPNLPHVLLSRTTGYHNLCSPAGEQGGSGGPVDPSGSHGYGGPDGQSGRLWWYAFRYYVVFMD